MTPVIDSSKKWKRKQKVRTSESLQRRGNETFKCWILQKCKANKIMPKYEGLMIRASAAPFLQWHTKEILIYLLPVRRSWMMLQHQHSSKVTENSVQTMHEQESSAQREVREGEKTDAASSEWRYFVDQKLGSTKASNISIKLLILNRFYILAQRKKNYGKVSQRKSGFTSLVRLTPRKSNDKGIFMR